jgi:hypothetical protein
LINLAPYENEGRLLAAEHPDATLEALPAKLPDEVPVTVPTLSNFLKHRKIPWKKTRHAAEQHRDDVAERRAAWKKLQEVFAMKTLVFLDAVSAGCKTVGCLNNVISPNCQSSPNRF